MYSYNIVRAPCDVWEDEDGNLIIGEYCVSAPQVSDSMIETEEVAQAHGTVILDDECSNRMMVTASGYLLGWTAPGTFCHINDGLRAHPCVVEAVEIEVTKKQDEFQVSTHFQFEREDYDAS